MLFQQPMALWGLVSLLVPIILHLFQLQRPKSMVFSDLRFLKEILQEQQRAKQLKHWLILLLRLLFLAGLVLAFAQPILPSKAGDTPRGVVVVIDNSASANNRWNDLKFLDAIKAKALSLIKAMPSDQEIILLHAGSTHVQQILPQEAIQQLAELQALPVAYTTAQLNEQLSFPQLGSGLWNIYVVGDFQESFLTEKPTESERFVYHLVPCSNTDAIPNLALDTAWFKQPVFVPGTNQELVVELFNYGNEKASSLDVTLLLNDQIKTIQQTDVPPHGKSSVNLSFAVPQEPLVKVQVKIADNGLTSDNELSLAFKTTDELPVVYIKGKESSGKLGPVLNLEPFSLQTYTPQQLDPTAISRAAAVVIEGSSEWQVNNIKLITDMVEKGQTVLFFPAGKPEIDHPLLQAFTGKQAVLDTSRYAVSVLNSELPLFRGMIERIEENPNLPATSWHYIYRETGPVPLSFSNGDAFYFERVLGAGKIWISSSGLENDAGNWGDHHLLLPLVYQSIFQAQNHQAGYEILGKNTTWSTGIYSQGPEAPIGILLGSENFIPVQFTSNSGELLFEPLTQINGLGSFPLTQGKDTLGWISFNLDHHESNSKFYTLPLLEPWGPKAQVLSGSADTIGTEASALSQGKPMWKYFILLAIVSLVVESILLRKKATTPRN